MKNLSIIAILFFSIQFSFSQLPCGTDKWYKLKIKEDITIKDKRKELERHTQQFLSEKFAEDTSLKIIPVVFHIIHNYGGENISKAQVLDALRIVNEDFKKINADTTDIISPFKNTAGKINLQFRLANFDEYGNCTDGITRTVSALTHNADDNVKNLISWNNDMYLNIWVVNNISFGAGGYSYYPGTAGQGYEGVVVLHTQLGSIGTSYGSNFSARTLTHEIGHYFNLVHTWGEGECGDTNNCYTDDGVSDTPNTIGNCSICNLSASNCGELENVQNYMDYSTCAKMFTNGQCTRMQAALNSTIGGRSYLWQLSNLLVTGTADTTRQECIPVADFLVNPQYACEGAQISFFDIHWNCDSVVRNWHFEGGFPNTSFDQKPVIQYDSAGVYDVTLKLTNSAGTDSLLKKSLIKITKATAKFSIPIYSESFENDSAFSTEWTIDNPDSSISWENQSTSAATGHNSLMLNNYNNFSGSVDAIISPSFNISAISGNPKLFFKVAYAQRSGSESDQLKVYYSKDCGSSWMQRYSKAGAQLSTAPITGSFFSPTSSQWREEQVNIAPIANSDNVLFKFEFTGKAGNNIYLDDILISGTSSNDLFPVVEKMNFYYDPRTKSVLLFDLPAENYTISVLDLTGRIMLQQRLDKSYQNDVEIKSLAKGIYIIQAFSANKKFTGKLIVND